MTRRVRAASAIAGAALILAAGCGSNSAIHLNGASGQPQASVISSVAGAASSAGGCTQSTDTASGLSIQDGNVVETVYYACTGSVTAFRLTLILIHNGTSLKPGSVIDLLPFGDGSLNVWTVDAPCEEGTWQLYMIVAWTVNGVTGYNPQSTFNAVTYSAGDCTI